MSKVIFDVGHDAPGETGKFVQLKRDDIPLASRDEYIEPRPGLGIIIQEGEIYTPRVEFEYINPPIEFGFMLTGRSRALFRQGSCQGLDYEMTQGSSGICCLPHSAGVAEWGCDAHVSMVEIFLTPAVFFEILRDDMDGIPRDLVRVAEGRVPKPFLWEGLTCPSRQVALQNLLHCPYRGGIRDLYYEGVALELVSCLLHECGSEFSRCGKNNDKPSFREVERIKAARNILLQDLENPPSLADLALRVGMSDTKLKRGFKAVFGKPVFQVYRDFRLDKAREYLEVGNMNVSEAAYRIGYLSLGHFSRAFANRFGVTPSRYLRGARSKVGQLDF